MRIRMPDVENSRLNLPSTKTATYTYDSCGLLVGWYS